MDAQKAPESQPKQSLLARVFSAEGAIFCIGIACLVYGVADGFKVMQFFFGLCIVGGSVALHFVKKKDWNAHWAEHDRLHQEHRQRTEVERDKKNE